MKRITAFIVMLTLILSVLPVVSFAEDTQPAFEVIGSTIKNDKNFFELTMKVTPGSKGFFSAGMTLRYDKSVITPVAWDKDGTAVPMTSCTDWQNVAAVPAVCPTEISGKTALAYEEPDMEPETLSKNGYLYISAETALPVTTLPNDGKVITVRFKYVGADDDAIAASKQKVTDNFTIGTIVSLASDDVAASSPAGQMVFYGAGDADETEYYYTTETPTVGIAHDELLTTAPTFTLKENAESANTGGGGSASYFAALVFFDWDESTLLGSMVVDASLSADEIKTTINSFTKTQLPPDFDLSDWTDEKAKTVTTYNPAYPLASHNGYTFGKWIEYTSEDYTVYGNAVKTTDAGVMETISAPADPDYTNISDGLVLKAAYIANMDMDSLTDTTQRIYTVSNDTAPEAGYFGRFGTSTNYSLKFKVTRVNSDNQPVQRLRTTALRVVYTIGLTEIYSLVNMENVDEQIVEVAAPADADRVDVSVIDIGGVSDWAMSSAARSSICFVNSKKTDENNLGYVIYGTVNYINQQVAEEGATTFNAGIYNNVEITVTKGNVYGAAANANAVALRAKAATNIRDGQQQKLAAEGILYLSQKEMQNAVKYGNYKGTA
ncbi:MAG: hypothetical protein ACI4A5_11075 [Hominilimicola sp.]